MKLNFKEWNIIYEALANKAEQIENDMKWRIDYAKEHNAEETEEPKDVKELRAKLEALTGIIKKLENSAI